MESRALASLDSLRTSSLPKGAPQSEILANKKAHTFSTGPLFTAPRAGLGYYGRGFRLSLRSLPFVFLTPDFVGLFLPDRSAESSLRILQWGILANKKAYAFRIDPFVYWLPGQDSNLQPTG